MEKFGIQRVTSRIILQFGLLITTVITAIMALAFGSVDISLSDVINVIFGNAENINHHKIIIDVRLPRILYAVLIGGGLSISGAVFQAILMNPLAEPYILGISSGGTFGAVLSFVIGVSFVGTQLFAFLGAFFVMLLVFMLGKRYGNLEPNTLLLSGVMIGAFFSAAILLVMIFLQDSLRTAIYWMVGSLSFAKWNNLWMVGITVLVISIYFIVYSYKYNLLTLGDDASKTLGVNSAKFKNITYFLGSILIGAIVSVSGIIGFVGLIVPHVCRMIWGLDNRMIIPSSFFIGAIYLIIADTIARTIIAPSELPVGSITAIIGVPIFIYLLKTRFSMN